jgi:hypothetical protein
VRFRNAILILGLTALASAAPAQESLCNPCRLDVPADYQLLKPLPTEWPRPENAFNAPSTRYNLGAGGPIYGGQSMDPRRLRDLQRSLAAYQQSIDAYLRSRCGTVMTGRTVPPCAVDPAPAIAPPVSNPGPAGENAP